MPNKQIGTCLCGACKFTATLPIIWQGCVIVACARNGRCLFPPVALERQSLKQAHPLKPIKALIGASGYFVANADQP